jgi:nitroimidazol reductase NimA-like FMN-containing flavoprotein (pyridoxamine 5'-phosphate oxidase superfamily)
MKIVNASPEIPGMNREEVERVLESKLNLQLATIDDDGDPNIQPLWFNYDRDREKLLIITHKTAKKIKNLRNKHNVYFSIDDVNYPYKGVKGKGIAAIVEDPSRTIPVTEKIILKYLGTLDHPLAKRLTDDTLNGIEIVLEITPKFFSTWDFGKT